jgi:hypothetical protein
MTLKRFVCAASGIKTPAVDILLLPYEYGNAHSALCISGTEASTQVQYKRYVLCLTRTSALTLLLYSRRANCAQLLVYAKEMCKKLALLHITSRPPWKKLIW